MFTSIFLQAQKAPTNLVQDDPLVNPYSGNFWLLSNLPLVKPWLPTTTSNSGIVGLWRRCNRVEKVARSCRPWDIQVLLSKPSSGSQNFRDFDVWGDDDRDGANGREDLYHAAMMFMARRCSELECGSTKALLTHSALLQITGSTSQFEWWCMFSRQEKWLFYLFEIT